MDGQAGRSKALTSFGRPSYNYPITKIKAKNGMLQIGGGVDRVVPYIFDPLDNKRAGLVQGLAVPD